MKQSIADLEDKNFYSEMIALLESAKDHVVRSVNQTMVITYFEIGKKIVEQEQGGNDRAVYGKQLLKGLSKELTRKIGKGFSVDNLENMRRFYLVYGKSETVSRISETSISENAYHYPGAIANDNLGHLFITGSFLGEMGYMLGVPSSLNLDYTSNGGSVFTMRVDIEGPGEHEMAKPIFVDPIDNETAENDGESIDLVLIPNPTSGLTSVQLLNADPLKRYTINVIGVDGRVIYHGELHEGMLLLDCSTFANGLYTVWVTDQINAFSIKLVKTN